VKRKAVIFQKVGISRDIYDMYHILFIFIEWNVRRRDAKPDRERERERVKCEMYWEKKQNHILYGIFKYTILSSTSYASRLLWNGLPVVLIYAKAGEERETLQADPTQSPGAMSRQSSGSWSMTWIKPFSTWRYMKHKTEKCTDVSKIVHVMYGGAVSVSMRISKATTTPWVQLPESVRLQSSIFHLR